MADQQVFWLSNAFSTSFRDEVTINKELGRGNFGVVSLGKWKETEVAIKVEKKVLINLKALKP